MKPRLSNGAIAMMTPETYIAECLKAKEAVAVAQWRGRKTARNKERKHRKAVQRVAEIIAQEEVRKTRTTSRAEQKQERARQKEANALARLVLALIRKAEWVMAHGLPLKVTHKERQAIIDRQEGQCAICHQTSKLAIDHCHTTGRIRGALCGRCNIALGLFRDDPTILTAAIQYLANAA